MGLFNDMLSSDESLFLNEIALDYDYIPKMLPYRESQQRYIATCIKPLFAERNGRNLVIHGAPGIGKTAATRWVLRDLEEETDDIIPIYINCWKKNTSYKILVDICEQLDFKFTQNKKTDELFTVVKNILNKKSAVFAFDEVDKLEDYDILYMILEGIYRKSILLLTNFKDWIQTLDNRIKSRLIPEMIEFKPYNEAETEGILKYRAGFAFPPDVCSTDVIKLVAQKTYSIQDIRTGLYLLREAGNLAEDEASRKITLDHAKKAISKMEDFSSKDPEELEQDSQLVLSIVKNNSGKKIGELFKIYEDKGGQNTYKTFQRKIDKLHKNSFIDVEKTNGGAEGNTTIINAKEVSKKLTDF